MNNTEKYKYWVMMSDYDTETVKVLIDNERWMQVSAICHSAIERLIKGMTVYHTGKEAPKSHNITFLSNKLAETPAFAESEAGKRFINEKNEYIDMMLDIMFYHVSDYPFSYQKVMDRFIGESAAREIYAETQKLAAWLKSFQAE